MERFGLIFDQICPREQIFIYDPEGNAVEMPQVGVSMAEPAT
jgi:hypothetical protein